MMASPAAKVPFVQVAMDLESDTVGLVATSGRSLRPSRSWLQRLVISAGVVFLVAIVGVATLGRRSGAPEKLTPVEDTTHSIQAEEVAGAFQQCGGEGYPGTKCCKKGCACLLKTRFYSMCRTPTNTGDCDFSAAQREVKLAKVRARMASVHIDAKRKAAKEAEKEVAPTAEAYKKAFAPVPKLQKEGNKTRKAYLAAKKHYLSSKAEAEETESNLNALAGGYAWAKKTVAEYDKALAMNSGGQCAGINGQCMGQIPAEKACCVIGCVCVYKNDYYGQCLPPPGAPNCDGASYSAQMERTRANATRLQGIVESLKKKKEETAKAYVAANETYRKLRKAATKAGTARAIAEKLAREKKKKADAAAKRFKDLDAEATHAVNNVKYAAAMVSVWSKVANGDSCSNLKATEVAAEDPVDFEAIKEPKRQGLYIYGDDDEAGKQNTSDKDEDSNDVAGEGEDEDGDLGFEDDDDDLGFED